MKMVFVINPMAGAGKDIKKIEENILNTAGSLNAECETYITKAAGDGERFVREYLSACGGRARIIACGGDGTFNEVLNGAAGFDEAELGAMPMGTGNDFCRNFKHAGDFFSVGAQIKGKTQKCDAIRYSTDNKAGYCANMFNIGFDCNVADLTAKMKKKPFISGSMAYFLSIFAILIKKKGAKLKIDIDGKEKHTGPLLLTSVANGSYCGGGIMSNPLAEICDGFINVNIIYNISRLNFLSKLPFYMKGTHVKLKGIERVIFNTKCKRVRVTPLDGAMRLCIDGEITDAKKTEFEIVPEAFNFVVPSVD